MKSHNKLIISFSTIFLITLIALSIFLLNLEPNSKAPAGINNSLVVSRVIDGDTPFT